MVWTTNKIEMPQFNYWELCYDDYSNMQRMAGIHITNKMMELSHYLE
jgi:hypothetical protein